MENLRPARSRALLIAGLVASAAASLPVPAQPPIDLALLGTAHSGFGIDGIGQKDYSGRSVSGAGDVNGDGVADVIVGAWRADPGGVSGAGTSYVVFGKPDSMPVDLLLIGTAHPGFGIDGSATGEQTGYSVSGAGDVNGDGLADIIVGTPFHSEICYIVFGKSTTSRVSLSQIAGSPSRGFRIRDTGSANHTTRSVSGAGDVNGDGLADIIVGGQQLNSYAGESYVVFGMTTGTTVNLSELGTTHPGFRIVGAGPFNRTGWNVSGAGDVNGDGLADVIVGGRRNLYAGESYVVFGKADSTPVDLSLIGTTHPGFRIAHIGPHGREGYSASGAGDVNGDGLADLVVGAYLASPGGRIRAGESYVVFGKTDGAPVELSLIGATHPGFRIVGAREQDNSGNSVSGAGDVNGDGLADIIVGAKKASPFNISQAGESYVVFGKADGTTVDLSQLGMAHAGFRIAGIDRNDWSGFSVSGAGDVNGDGLADLLVGAPLQGAESGESYVIFSPMAAPATLSYKSARGAGTAHLSPIGVSGDGSNESTPDSRAWVGFADGDAASMQTVTIHRNQNLGRIFSPTVWEVSTDRTGWTSATVKFKYTKAEVEGLTEGNLIIYQAESIDGIYEPLAATLSASHDTVTAVVPTLSFFAVGEKRIFEGLVVK